MLKRPGILLTLASILMMYTPVSFSSGGRDSVFLKGTLLYNLDLFEVYCPYELLTCGDFLYLFDSDRSCYKLDRQSREITDVFTLPGCSRVPVNIDEEKVYALLTNNPSIVQYTLKSGRSQHIYLPKSFDYKCFALYERDMFLVADNSEYVYRLVNRDGEVVSNGGLRTEKNDDGASCMEYNAVNDVLAIVFPHRIDIIEVGSSLLKTCVQMEHCLDVSIRGNHIYALCPGSSANPDQSNHSCIYVFDLEGNTLRTYILDTTIRRFCITEEEGVLYGLTLEEELPIVKYELE